MGALNYFATRINTKFLRYVTPEMLVATILVGGIVILLKSVFVDGFTTNIGLNTTIVFSFFYALYLVFKNNYSIYQLSKYISEIESVELTPDFNKDDVARLRDHLHKGGRLIDTQATYTVLSKMMTNGFFFPTDDEARVIKSTLGNRIRLRRGHISFLASILVTLGLIGTFWGLILTISSIGETMVGISNSFSDGASLDLGALISGISKPLGGMGVAFSSSLYGLAGSLVIGVLSTLATKAQNNFIERFARWVDEHIPEINHELAERLNLEDKIITTASHQQQDDLIKAFVMLATETHTQLRALGENVKSMVTVSEQELALQKELCSDMKSIKEVQTSLTETLNILAKTQLASQERAEKQTDSIVTAIKDSEQNLSSTLQTTNKQLKSLETEQKTANKQQQESLKSYEKTNKDITSAVIDITSNISDSHSTTQESQSNITRLLEKSAAKTDLVTKELETINAQLSESINHMNNNAQIQQKIMSEKLSHTSNSIAGHSEHLNSLNSNFKEFSHQHLKHTEKLNDIIQSLNHMSKKQTDALSRMVSQEFTSSKEEEVETPIKTDKKSVGFTSLSEAYVQQNKQLTAKSKETPSLYKKIKKQITSKRK